MGLSYKVGARPSPLSKAQVSEVEREIREYADVHFEPVWIETVGDRDRKTSLKELGQTDFFTKDIDRALIEGEIDLAIHSAKDLPERLPEKLGVMAITRGVDSRDTLVMREGATLPPKPRIATSSVRRADRVKKICPEAVIVDIRGNVNERIEKVMSGEVDALVAPEAALIRLQLTHLNRIFLEGKTAARQGQLAVVARVDDKHLIDLFEKIDSRPSLYTGLRTENKNHFHCPLIKVVSRPSEKIDLEGTTHLLFTSRSAVEIFFQVYSKGISSKIVVIGQGTEKTLRKYGYEANIIAEEATSEGVVEALKKAKLSNPSFFWPRSSKARPVIAEAFKRLGWHLEECILYDTVTHRPNTDISLEDFGKVIFTSPSTIDAFIEIFGAVPEDKRIQCIGPVTDNHLRERLEAQAIGQAVT